MKASNKICFLLPIGDSKIYGFASSVLERYSNTENVYFLGVFAFKFKKGEEYTIKAFDGKSRKASDLLLEAVDKEEKLYVVQNNLPDGLSPFFFRKKDSPISVETENGKENLYALDPVDLPHFEEACKTHQFFFVGEGRDPRLTI